MRNLVPIVASILSGAMIVERACDQPDWRIIPWTLMFAFWMLVWFLQHQTNGKGTITHNSLPIRK